MLISIIIPCYNSQLTIERAINSALSQTYKNFEIICVNDGSTDNTLEILKRYESRIRIVDVPNGGGSRARNLGLNLAKGEFVQFLDSDDELLPEKLSHQFQLLQQCDKEIAFIAASTYINSGSKMTIKKPDEDIWSGLILTRLGITSANLFNSRLLRMVNGWDEKLKSSQEYDLMFRLLQINSNVIIDKQPLAIIHKSPNSISSKKRDYQDHNFFRAFELRNKIITYLKQIGSFNSTYQDLYHQKVFKLLQFLQKDYPEEACRLKNEIIPAGFVPDQKLNSRLYVIFYKLFGFNGVSYLKRFMLK